MRSVFMRHRWEPYLWILPSVLLMLIFVVFPIGIVFRLAFSNISRAGVVGDFAGLKNFQEAVSSAAFPQVMLNTLIWVVSVVGLSTLTGFICAMVLNQEFVGRKIARSIMVFPWAASLVIQASVWNYIIKMEYGNLNNILLNLGFIQSAVNWRASYQIEFVWECAIGIIDGAGFWKKLRHVTLPLVKPSLTVSTVLNIIYVFNSFPIIYTITKGAPANKTDTMVTYLYMLAFYDQKKGPATALSVIGFVILCVASGIYMFITMRKEDTGL